MHRFVGGLVEEKKDGLSLKRITMEETIGTPAVATPSSHLVEWVVTLSLNRQVKIYFRLIPRSLTLNRCEHQCRWSTVMVAPTRAICSG